MKKLSDLMGSVVPDVEKMVEKSTEPFVKRLDMILDELRSIRMLLQTESRDEVLAVPSVDGGSAHPSRLYPEMEPNDP